MASIHKRGDSWRAQVRKKGYRAQFASFNTKAQAQAWATDVEARMGRGDFQTFTQAKQLRITDALDRFADQVLSQLKSQGWPSHLKRL